jgi:two-component system sensor kinase FixL
MDRVLRDVVASANLPKSIQTEFKLPAGMPNVMCDEQQIVIAFHNLIRNARDAMPDGGAMSISANVHDGFVDFSVSDTGMGIAEGDLDRILEPLFTTKARGMGLGLSITRAIVEKNQGSLSVTSELARGSTFVVRLTTS